MEISNLEADGEQSFTGMEGERDGRNIIRREGKQKQGLFVEISCEVRDAPARECRGREMTALFLRKVRFKWA